MQTAPEQNVLTLIKNLKSVGVLWRPHLSVGLISSFTEPLQKQGIVKVTVTTVEEAEVAVQAGFQEILILNFCLTKDFLERLAKICESASIMVACDHFVQAEAISEVCGTRKVGCQILLELNLGHAGPGVRPGPDAIELARGILTLPNIHLAGIAGRDHWGLRAHQQSDLCQYSVCHESTPQIQGLKTLLSERHQRFTDLVRLMTKNSIDCKIVSADALNSPALSPEASVITEVRTAAELHFMQLVNQNEKQSDEFKDPQNSVEKIITSVMSRPELSRAVLHLNTQDAALISAESEVRFTTPSGKELSKVKVIKIDQRCLSVHLEADAQNLVIGNEVHILLND